MIDLTYAFFLYLLFEIVHINKLTHTINQHVLLDPISGTRMFGEILYL